MTPDFWRGKRVFVTGNTGFKGSWLSLWLTRAGAEVTGYSLDPPTTPSLFNDAGVATSAPTIHGDVRDLNAVTNAMQQARPEIVLHLAAQSLVRASYTSPVETYATNVMGTVNVLEAVRHSPETRVAVMVTSDKCYENREWPWGYRENEAMGGHDPYSNSKGCAELVTSAYRRSFFAASGKGNRPVAVASVRAGNVIGGGDWAADRLVPDIMRAFARGEKAIIRNPGAIRPWQHVLDPLSGYLTLAERLWDADASGELASGWNFGPNDSDARPVSWVADRLAEFWSDGAAWQHQPSDGPHEAHYLKLDCSKAKSALAWEPTLPLTDALQWTVQWYRTADGAAREVTENQISEYERRMTRRSEAQR